MKKFAIIAGAMAMAGALFLASPVSAQDGPSISATLNDDGSATVTGAGWSGAPDAGLFVTVCPGADVTSDAPVNAGNALVVCPTLVVPDSGTNNPTVGDDGTWTFDLSASAVGDVPETGVVILTGCLPLGCTSHSATTVLTAGGAEEPAAEEAAEEPADEQPEAEGAGGDEDMDEAEDMDDGDDMDEAEDMDDGEDMDEAEDMDDGEDMMADTGSESGLLAVIGVSILLAGLFAVGIGRRFAKRS